MTIGNEHGVFHMMHQVDRPPSRLLVVHMTLLATVGNPSIVLRWLIVTRIHLPLKRIGKVKLSLLDLLTRRCEHGLW